MPPRFEIPSEQKRRLALDPLTSKKGEGTTTLLTNHPVFHLRGKVRLGQLRPS